MQFFLRFLICFSRSVALQATENNKARMVQQNVIKVVVQKRQVEWVSFGTNRVQIETLLVAAKWLIDQGVFKVDVIDDEVVRDIEAGLTRVRNVQMPQGWSQSTDKVDTWNTIQSAFLLHYNIMWDMVNVYRVDLLVCSEDDIRKSIIEFMDKANYMYAKKTVRNRMSDLRCMFRKIGRQYEWSHQQEIIKIMGDTIGNPSNPVPSSLEKQMKKLLLDKKKSLNLLIKPKNESKEGIPISIGLTLYLTVKGMVRAQEILNKSQSTKSLQMAENLLYLGLLRVLMMHEAGRPFAEFQKHLSHSDINMLLHEVVPALTLVFLKTETLCAIFESGSLGHYCFGPWKGKQTSSMAPRVKTVIPPAQNYLCLVWHYVVCMRILYSINPASLSPKVFPDKVLNMSQKNKNFLKSLKFDQKLTFYSIRYAAAEEELKIGIPKEWTKVRMGHSVTSNQSDMYADNNKARARRDNQDLPLGSDVKSPRLSGEAFEFNPVRAGGLTVQSNWLENVKMTAAMKQDFADTAYMVKDYLSSSGSGASGARIKLLDKMSSIMKAEGIKMFKLPMGGHYNVHDQLLSSDLMEELKEDMGTLTQHFKPVPSPDNMPVLQYYAQVMYGNWDNPYKEKEKGKTPKPQPQEQSESEPESESEDTFVCLPPTKKAKVDVKSKKIVAKATQEVENKKKKLMLLVTMEATLYTFTFDKTKPDDRVYMVEYADASDFDKNVDKSLLYYYKRPNTKISSYLGDPGIKYVRAAKPEMTENILKSRLHTFEVTCDHGPIVFDDVTVKQMCTRLLG